MKTRREVLQGMIVAIGGTSMLTACGGIANVVSSSGQSLRFYSDSEFALISRVADLIIPRTDTPGALDVNVPGFMDGLMAEWANSDSQQSHHEIVADLEQMLGAGFVTDSESAAERTLAALDARAFDERTGYGSYRSLKGLITQSYFASEDGALQEQGWVAVPGRWDPRVEI